MPSLAAPVDLDDSFDLSLDDLDVGLDEPAAPAAVAETTLDDLGLDFDMPAAPASTAAADMEFDLDLGGDGAGDSLSLGDDLADFSLGLETESKPAAAAVEDDFMLSLDDEPVAPGCRGQRSRAGHAGRFRSVVADETPATPAEDSFAAQLDEVSAELNELSSGLADELPVAQPEAPSAASLDMDDDFDFLLGYRRGRYQAGAGPRLHRHG